MDIIAGEEVGGVDLWVVQEKLSFSFKDEGHSIILIS
jgi:hypothetical protein